MNPVVLKCLAGAGAVGGAVGGGVTLWKLNSSKKSNEDEAKKKEKEDQLKKKLGELGIPEKCWKGDEIKEENIKQCNLTEEDLKKIKFHGFQKEGNTEVTKLWVGSENKNWNRNQEIKLTFRDGKYIFENYFQGARDIQSVHRAITITRGSDSVTLDGNMDSEFTVEEDGLKKQEVTDLGFPKRCEIGEKEENKTCELSENDIKRLKLKETGVSPDILNLTPKGSKKMNLKIEKTEEEGYTDKKKYILEFMGELTLTILETVEVNEGTVVKSERTANTLSFVKGIGKTFKNENNLLVAV